MIRVAHVINRYGWSGGAENQLSENLRHFSPDIDSTVVALFQRDEMKSKRDHDRTPIIYLSHEGDGVSRFELYRRLEKTLRALKPDLIHSSLADASLGARIFALRNPDSLVLESLVNLSHEEIRTMDNPAVTSWKLALHRGLDRFTMRNVSHFHALTESVARSWVETVRISSAKITVIPRGVDIEMFKPLGRDMARAELIAELGLSANSQIILNVGRQEPQKGHKYLIGAMPQIAEACPDAVLLLVGRDGNSTMALTALIASVGTDHRIRLLGVREDIPKLLRAADCFVFPSLFEGLGVSLLEAMASGCACVVSDAPVFKEVVESEESALVVPARDSDAVAKATLRVLQDHELAGRLGRKARSRVVESYRVENTAARIEKLYLELGRRHE